MKFTDTSIIFGLLCGLISSCIIFIVSGSATHAVAGVAGALIFTAWGFWRRDW